MTDDILEEWRAIPGFPSYEVSSLARVRRILDSRTSLAGKILKPWLENTGYLAVSLRRENITVRMCLHVCIARAFHGLPPAEGMEVAHGDGDKLNNHPSNIRWATSKENSDDIERHGRRNKGERNGMARITTELALAIKQSTLRPAHAARHFGVSHQAVSDIRTGRRWKHLSEIKI